MPTGSIISFKADKGYGFIRPKGSEDSRENVYIHITTLQAAGIETVEPGQRLSYELQTGENGKVSAIDVKIIE